MTTLGSEYKEYEVLKAEHVEIENRFARGYISAQHGRAKDKLRDLEYMNEKLRELDAKSESKYRARLGPTTEYTVLHSEDIQGV